MSAGTDIRTPASGEGAGGRLRSIDALRAIAALLVVWLHVTESFAAAGGPALGGRALADAAWALDLGRVGVVVFFLISGFVIPPSLDMSRPAPLASFAVKRLLRIYPAYWLSIPLSAFAAWWLWDRPFGAAELLVNATLLQDMLGVPAASGVYWTLLVELAFYALCMLLAWGGSLHHAQRIGAIALALAGLHLAIVFGFWLDGAGGTLLALLPFHLSLMLTGSLCRQAQSGPGLPIVPRRMLRALLLFFLVVFPAGAAWALGPAHNYAVSSALGVAIFLAGTRLIRIESRLSDWLGRISYSIYLFHMPVFYPLLWWVTRQPLDSAWRNQHLAIWFMAVLAATLLVAELAYRFVERPGMRLGQRWARRLQQRKAGVLPTARPRVAV
ncbi:MAG: acyltransferase [Xanthomonadales bacterium]|nr:acyltransferase [Xanthomonadales bacterium]